MLRSSTAIETEPDPAPYVGSGNARRMLITGAASGIGRALVENYASRSHTVFAVDFDRDGLQGLARIAERKGWDIDAQCLDVRDETAIEQLSAAIAKRNVGVLINNAGLQHVAPVEEFPAARWQQLVDVMLVSSFRMTSAILPAMKKQNYGRVINIGSIHSLVASPFKSAYVAAKHGLLGFAKTIALETAAFDITVNTICPSYVRTKLVDRQIEELARRHEMTEKQVIDEIMLKPMPKRAFVEIDELVGVIDFLVSRSSRNITGQAIAVDGGWTAQ